MFIGSEAGLETGHLAQFPDRLSIAPRESLICESDPERQSRVFVNARPAILHREIRVRVVRNRGCVVEEFTGFAQADSLVSHNGAYLYSTGTQFVYFPPSQRIPNDGRRVVE